MFFELGLTHILDLEGYDHILFVIVLCASYDLKFWKKILWLVTAFTLGHSITLALSTLSIIEVNSQWIEVLIKITILITSIMNILFLFTKKKNLYSLKREIFSYVIALVFGLIHGLGFASYLSQVLLEQKNNILSSLFLFNLGVEAGQIIIVFIYLLFTLFIFYFFRFSQKIWSLFLSVLTIIILGYMIFL